MISTQSVPAHAGGREHGGRRPGPCRVPELAHLSLDDLRTYRRELVSEEGRISYWRRILQARLDLVIDGGDEQALARLRSVLDAHADSSRRLALMPLTVSEQAPPTPDLTVLWETTSEGPSTDCTLLARLADAEHQLSAYRSSLHARLDAATQELIARYRDEPGLALRALPRANRSD